MGKYGLTLLDIYGEVSSGNLYRRVGLGATGKAQCRCDPSGKEKLHIPIF